MPLSARKRSNGAVIGAKVTLEWTENANSSFENLKEVMYSDLVLALPRFDSDFIVTSDASENGYGAVLEQIIDDEKRIIAYFSKCYTKAQHNYATCEKELLSIVMAVEYWKTYLYGRKFINYSDHQPLTWLLTKKDPHPRLERWIMRLSLYQYEIVYKKGTENIVADALSRLANQSDVNSDEDDDYHDVLIANIEEEGESDLERFKEQIPLQSNNSIESNIQKVIVEPSSTIKDLYTSCLEEQMRDPDLKWVKDLLLEYKEKKPNVDKFANIEQRILFKEYDNLRVIDGIIYRAIEDETGHQYMQFVLPKHLVHHIFERTHSRAYNGHLGRRKTYSLIEERFYRPFLRRDIFEYVRTCDTCQKIKSTGRVRTAEMLIVKPDRTNQLVATDFTGPFKTSSFGNKYIMVVVDCFSKYMICIPVPNKETNTTANTLLEHWFWVFGIPEQILSDQGKEYNSMLMDSICQLLDIERLKTTPYHPQCDGQSEKAVEQIKKMIRGHIDEDQEHWDLGLTQLCFSYNSSIHETTGYSPFYIMFGSECRILC